MEKTKMGENGGGEERDSLFETKEEKGRLAYKLFAATVFVGICMIWLYRIVNIAAAGSLRWASIGMLMAELWFGFYWLLTQSLRWNVVHRYAFKDRLSVRYGDNLPGIDVFVCTADPTIEPPILVINTILSVMSYNYPPKKLNVYLSDDGGSQFTFYAILEASAFAKHWIPFCKKFKVEPRCPAAYFAQHSNHDQAFLYIKKLYEDMKRRIEKAVEMCSIPEGMWNGHKGFSEWSDQVTKANHQSIVQIIIDSRDENAIDMDGCRLPGLVYMSREKRPHIHHNFKAGSINAMMRVSSEISNAPIILILDCDMYSKNSEAAKEALCFFMDEERGHEICYVQHPQSYNNITKNDIYSNSSPVIDEVMILCFALICDMLHNHKLMQIELAGLDGYDGALFSGTGCFHRRESLSGKSYSRKQHNGQLNLEAEKNLGKTVGELEEASKILADCSYEMGSAWGKEMGMMYGCPVEDIITGLTILTRGWKSLYYHPSTKAFVGVAPPTLDIALIQYKRWSEGMFQIFFSKWCPFTYTRGKIKFGAQMGYCVYLLWAPTSLAVIYYLLVPPLCLLRGISLFPKVSSLWFIPFVYVFLTKNAYSVIEVMRCGSTLKSWWNTQRMWTIRMTTSYLFAFFDIINRTLGLAHESFSVTPKAVTEDILKRYEKEIMEFGSTSVMFIIIATLALLNLFCLVGGIIKNLVLEMEFRNVDKLIAQVILCWLMVMLNLPVYHALFIHTDKGAMPSSILCKSITLASLACLISVL